MTNRSRTPTSSRIDKRLDKSSRNHRTDVKPLGQDCEALVVAQQEKENAARREQAEKIKAAKKRRAEFEAEVHYSYYH